MSKPIHPILFAAFPILFLIAHNRDVTSPSDAVVPLLITIGIVLVVQLIGGLAFRSHNKAAVVLSALAVLFFSYGHVWTVLDGRRLAGVRLDDAVLAPIWSALALGMLLLVARTSRRLSDLTRALNVIAAVLVISTLVTVGSDIVRSDPQARADVENVFGLERPEKPRDVYYLIFDRYADAETLRTHLGFDNSSIVDWLESEGFQVTPGSRANYENTHMSLASSLNMQHLDEVMSNVDRPSTDVEPIFEAIKHSAVAQALQSVGYRYVHVGSWASFTASSPIADVNLKPIETSELTRALYGSTALSPILRRTGLNTGDDNLSQRDATRGALRALDSAVKLEGPKYVFTHFIPPHPPYVFDRNGKYTPDDRRDGNVHGYLEQVRYVNREIRRIVTKLLDVPADEQPIVIIQADEGPYPRLSTKIPKSWSLQPAEDARVKYGIFNAYLFPGPPSEITVWRSISPVNSFRVVFNRYFGTHLPLLPDESYAIRDKRDVYTLVPLGDAVRREPKAFARQKS